MDRTFQECMADRTKIDIILLNSGMDAYIRFVKDFYVPLYANAYVKFDVDVGTFPKQWRSFRPWRLMKMLSPT